MDDETYDYLAGVAATVEVSPCVFLDRSVFLDSDPYERLTTMAQQARANEAQFLEHLILRAEASGTSSRLCRPLRVLGGSCGARILRPSCPPIVADLRNAA